MKIYTSYFANWRNFPKQAVPIAICRKPPKGFAGLCYDKLAPTYEVMAGMKNPGTRDFFAVKYFEGTLKSLIKEEVLKDLAKLSEGNDVVLLCYEKPTDFCHRHLVAKWLGFNSNEIELRR